MPNIVFESGRKNRINIRRAPNANWLADTLNAKGKSCYFGHNEINGVLKNVKKTPMSWFPLRPLIVTPIVIIILILPAIISLEWSVIGWVDITGLLIMFAIPISFVPYFVFVFSYIAHRIRNERAVQCIKNGNYCAYKITINHKFADGAMTRANGSTRYVRSCIKSRDLGREFAFEISSKEFESTVIDETAIIIVVEKGKWRAVYLYGAEYLRTGKIRKWQAWQAWMA